MDANLQTAWTTSTTKVGNTSRWGAPQTRPCGVTLVGEDGEGKLPGVLTGLKIGIGNSISLEHMGQLENSNQK